MGTQKKKESLYSLSLSGWFMALPATKEAIAPLITTAHLERERGGLYECGGRYNRGIVDSASEITKVNLPSYMRASVPFDYRARA